MRNALIRCLLLWAISLWPLIATAQSLISERAYFEDRGGAMGLSEVRQSNFSKAEKSISLGYSHSTLWLRLLVRSPDSAQKLVLHISPATLDEVTLYSPRPEGSEGSAGYDAVKLDGWRPLPHQPTLINAPAGLATHYLRVRTSGAVALSVDVMTEAQAQSAQAQRSIFLGAVLASILPVMAVLLVLFAQRRDGVYLLLLGNIGAALAGFLIWFGHLQTFGAIGRSINSNEVPHFLALIHLFAAFAFYWAVFDRIGMPRWGRTLGLALALAFMPLPLLFFWLDRQVLLTLAISLGAGAAALFIPLVVGVFRRQRPAVWPIAVLIVTLLLFALHAFLTLLGVLTPVDAGPNLPAWRLMASPLVFGLILWVMGRERRRLLEAAATNAAEAGDLAAQESERRKTQEGFMTMLMHELKAPLSSVQLASASLGRRINPDTEAASQTHSIRRSVDDLIETIEHCVQAAENVQNDVSIDNTSFSLTGMLADLLNQVASDRIDLLGPEDARVHTDKHKLESMLWHLLNQALKDSPAHSRVELAVQASARDGVQGLLLVVTHEVGPADIAGQHDVVASSEPAQSVQSGSGLDMWLAQELALQLGLALEIHVDPQRRGSRIWLPGA